MRIYFGFLLFGLLNIGAVLAEPAALKEPVAERQKFIRTVHGTKLVDNYAWLKADNWQAALKNPALLPAKIKSYLRAENQYFSAATSNTKALRKVLFKELSGRNAAAENEVPDRDGKFAYFWRNVKGKNHTQLVRRAVEKFADDADLYSINPSKFDQVVLDGNELAAGKPGFVLKNVAHTSDHRLLAYSVDLTGSEYYQIKVREISSGKVLSDKIENTDGWIEWMPDGSGFFYVKKNSSGRQKSIWYHKLGTLQKTDRKIFETPDKNGFTVSVWATRNKKFFCIGVGNIYSREVYLFDPKQPIKSQKLVARRSEGVDYSIRLHGEKLYIRTNADGAKDYKIVVAPVQSPERKNWRDFVPHKPGRLIVNSEIFANHLMRFERENGQEKIVVIRLDTGQEHTIEINQQGYDLNYTTGYEFKTNILRMTYSSLTTPVATYDYNMDSRERVLRKRQIIPSGHNPKHYVSKRLLAVSHDGEKVPLSILYHRDTVLDGSAPVFMTGYGAYGTTTYASFNQNAFSLANRGFIYVKSHPRGGKDKGQAWYENGRRFKKTNTYKDFIAVAQFLIDHKYTSKGKIVAYGVSAGGMIMGYIANETTGIFGAIIADVPFVDVLNTMLDTSLPLTPGEWPEWGNPIKNPAAFAYIKSYSPYDNVRSKVYPAMFVLASVADARVTYWEPAKWVAKIRALRTNKAPLLLETNMTAGHSGSSGRYTGLRKVAKVYGFAIKVMGKENAPVFAGK